MAGRRNHGRRGVAGAAARGVAAQVASDGDFLGGGVAFCCGEALLIGVAFLQGGEEGAVAIELAVVLRRGDANLVAAAAIGGHDHVVGAPVVDGEGLFVEEVGTLGCGGDVGRAVALEGREGFAVGGDLHAREGAGGAGYQLIALPLHEVDGQGVAGVGGIAYQVAGEHHGEGGVVEGGDKARHGI